MVDDAMFTMLLPTRMVVSSLSKSSAFFSALWILLSVPSGSMLLSLVRLIPVYAVSEAEKNADSASRTAITASRAMSSIVSI